MYDPPILRPIAGGNSCTHIAGRQIVVPHRGSGFFPVYGRFSRFLQGSTFRCRWIEPCYHRRVRSLRGRRQRWDRLARYGKQYRCLLRRRARLSCSAVSRAASGPRPPTVSDAALTRVSMLAGHGARLDVRFIDLVRATLSTVPVAWTATPRLLVMFWTNRRVAHQGRGRSPTRTSGARRMSALPPPSRLGGRDHGAG